MHYSDYCDSGFLVVFQCVLHMRFYFGFITSTKLYKCYKECSTYTGCMNFYIEYHGELSFYQM